ncbi:hypothetical protein JCM5353_000168 [Sporobolomyces roseus]
MPSLRSIRRRRATISRFLLFVLALSFLLISTQSRWESQTISTDLKNATSVLWVIAHPDDESFFFAPSILNLLNEERGVRGSLLCLSIGDYEGVGAIRKMELQESCATLGIESSRCSAINHPQLQDSPTADWPGSVIKEIVKQHVDEWGVDAIITFDGYGVSGHANHRSLYEHLSAAKQDEAFETPVYSVRSSNVLAKYTSLLLLPFALLKHFLSSTLQSSSTSSLFVSSFDHYARARQSFKAHQSQSRWFRTLFVSASRYLWYVQVDRV